MNEAIQQCREALIELRDQQRLPRKAAGYQKQIDELDAYASTLGWLPIADAPKDGTPVLVAVRYTSWPGGIREDTWVQTTAYLRDWSKDWNLVDAGMNYPLLERLARWWCARFGHRTRRDMYGIEVCRCCRSVLSTPYSRARSGST